MDRRTRLIIDTPERGTSALTKRQLEQTLRAIPLSLKVTKGTELPNVSNPKIVNYPTILLVNHGAQVITIRPQRGFRIYDGCFFGDDMNAFTPSRVLDEALGHGESNSYSFNTQDLGLPFRHRLMLDVHKYGL